MIDREKVIEELDKIADEVNPWKESPPLRCDIPYPLLCDAIALLKEQEAVRPVRQHSGGGTTWWNICGNCRTAINPNDKFCHECGKAVK